jgi:hypothetical protein
MGDDVGTIVILISALLLFLIVSLVLRYRTNLCGSREEGVPCCTQVIMDLCCMSGDGWGAHIHFQHAMIRRFLTTTDLVFGGFVVLTGAMNMSETPTRSILCVYLMMIGASLMLFEFCSRLFSLEAQCRKLFGFMYGPAGRVSFFIVVGAMCSVIDTIGVIMGGASLFLAVLNYGIIHQV